MSPLRRRSRLALLTAAIALPLPALPGPAADEKPAATLTLRPGDHVCLIGNTLADRVQHDGWLETYLQARFPSAKLVFRNLGFSGDEVGGFTEHPDFHHRLRSYNFGSSDHWLNFCKADVIFAFFGYNESFAGPAGLEQFTRDLESFIRHSRAQKYNGKDAPRLVLFSPIAHEDLHDRNLPDGSENNRRLELYTAALRKVARDNGVPFVDLFGPTRDLYARAARPLTINGVHLTEDGDRQLAAVIDRSLFAGQPGPRHDDAALERLRRAVVDKDFHWFNRYRTVDGYSIYGGRADEPKNGQSNRAPMAREMEVLDVMTANRDRRIWELTQGRDLKVDDSNTPPFIPVRTNKPGPGPGGTFPFLGGEEAIGKMTVAKGMKVTLFASEKEFPELAKPVQMSFDPRGRLWVAAWPSYPHWKPREEMNDKLLILEDTDGDGRADRCTVFADHLHCPTGFEFWGGGVLVAQAPDLVFLKDTDGDGKADVRVRVLHGLDSADTHHTANSFVLDPGGGLYFQEGTFHHTQVETPYGPPVRCANAGVYRYEPRTQKFDAYITHGFANPHGHVFDRWGQDIVVDGTGANPYHAAQFSGHLDYPHKHPSPPQVYQQRTRPCPGMEFLFSRHFPEANQGNLLVANVIGFQGILQYKISDRDSSFAGTEVEPILSSSDPNFRPSDVKVGPDGAIWFIDWQNPIIGHLQHNLRDPNRDRTHGRVYRVTCEGRPLSKSPKIAGEPVEKLLELLKEPEDRVRYRARIELGGRPSDQVVAAAKKWAAALDPSDPGYEHDLLEALWLHQAHNVVDAALLQRLLVSPDFHARAAATRVLCYWRDRVPEALALLKKQAADDHPRVRLEAVRAASFFTVPEAIEVALISSDRPSDPYLEFTRGETLKALDPYVKKAIAQGREIAFTTPAGARYFLKNVGTDSLLKMKRSRGVYLELLFRKGVRDEYRTEALAGLARLEKKDEARVLVDAVRSQDEQQNAQNESVVFDLIRLLTGRPSAELAGVRPDLETLATGARLPVTRQLGFVALIAADGSVDRAWALGTRSVSALRDLVRAMPLVRDPGQRAALYPKVEPLLAGLPRELAGTPQARAVLGRYVRIELPGRRRTLTLAEVEVYSDGRNVARGGKASQKNTAHGGRAGRAIDGNTAGSYGGGGQTHTQEDTEDPWWQVDLGAEYPIDRIVVYNRTDGDLGRRLDGFTLEVLDAGRNVVFARKGLPAPAEKDAYEFGGSAPERLIRHAAMNALTSVRGQEEAAFKALARFVQSDADRHAAVGALLRIPPAQWPRDEARPLLDALLASIRKVPVAERTGPAALDALQLADGLATLLPREQARKVRRELGELGVRLIRLATVPDQMLFDKERLVVQAGKPVEVVFENNDLMPHNFVITQPGALEEVGTQAEAQATQPGAAERHYVPDSPKVLVKSRLLQPRDAQKLDFRAPAKPGVYPYVCTYPGHWRRMYGALYVVADLDDYQADPEGYLARHPLPIADELLKFNRPRKEWVFADLAPAVEQLETGRSFANGKQMFQVANCVACHRMNGVGTEIGPDLTRLDPKQQKPVEILKDIVEPSFRINDKYQTYVFELESGKTVTGLILEETRAAYKVIENPLVKAQPLVLKKAEVAERTKSMTSIMPKGMLDKLTREEILDLVAYIAARGDPHHKLFQGGGHDHHAGH
jgi:putative heme-binding domain-containing protein